MQSLAEWKFGSGNVGNKQTKKKQKVDYEPHRPTAARLIRATAYLDMANVSAVIISTPDGLFKVIIACCIDQRGRPSISW